MKKIAVLISGSGSNLEAIADACSKNKINGEITCVISNNSSAYGIKRAKNYNLKTFVVDHNLFGTRSEFDNEIEKILIGEEIQLVVLAGFMRVLNKEIVNKFSGKMINLHPSLLPLYPGLNTHDKVIKNNDCEHGISIHYVSPELDAGPIIAQGRIKVRKNEDIKDLEKRIHQIEHRLLPEIINEICIGNIYLDKKTVKFKNNNITNYIKNFYDE
ncbi:MAG: phosphoribosylglycinamide formyltransferase [Gammaproteobacteria bacterium]|nr:phosphoribosylglycinamide formyltransferase [Gammaproteobacteria bacterium]|tara:strand:+ start:126 stop:770 length:645 start_codon:yes stop_codon:yes gene_type:complete